MYNDQSSDFRQLRVKAVEIQYRSYAINNTLFGEDVNLIELEQDLDVLISTAKEFRKKVQGLKNVS